jgi:putative redox protein
MINAIAKHKCSDDNYYTRVVNGSHSFIVDEPTTEGGQNAGASPTGHLCTAISSCTAITLKMYLQRKGWEAETIEVSASKHKDFSDNTDHFAVVVTLKSELDKEQLNRVAKISAACPIHKIIARGNPVTVEVKQV